jgi:hypothetical protein
VPLVARSGGVRIHLVSMPIWHCSQIKLFFSNGYTHNAILAQSILACSAFGALLCAYKVVEFNDNWPYNQPTTSVKGVVLTLGQEAISFGFAKIRAVKKLRQRVRFGPITFLFC